MSAAPILLSGAPDLLAQAFDKLIANAIGFAAPGTPITIGLQRRQDVAELEVGNTGPRLPPGPPERLFESMVSIREGAAVDAEPHLGLGLYVVQLVARFHRGSASAQNWGDAGGEGVSGVVLRLTLPVIPS